MKPVPPKARQRFVSTILPGLFCFSLAVSDTVKTKDGKEYTGTITSEDSAGVTIKYQLTPKIPDIKTIPRSEIVSVVKQSPEDLAALEVKALVPTEDFMMPSDYKRLIAAGPDKFMATHPGSRYRAEIDKVKQTLTEEMTKSRQGMRKVDGKWLGAREMQANEYNINALKTLRTMEKLFKAERFRDVLLEFRSLDESGKFSIHYVPGVELAIKALDRYAGQLEQMAKDVPQKLRKREEDLRTLTEDQKKVALVERDRQKKEFVAVIAEEKKQKMPFTSISETEVSSLQEALKQVTAEKARMTAIKTADVANSARGYERILKLIGEQKFEEAAVRLDEFIKNDKSAGNDKNIKDKAQELKKLRESQLREMRQRELLERTRTRAPESTPPEKPPAPPEKPPAR